MGMSASQIATIFCEMYNSGKNGPKQMMRCCVEDIRLSRLSGAMVYKGKLKFEEALTNVAAASAACGPSKMIFIETSNSSDPSLALHFYLKGKAPGFGGRGVEQQDNQTHSTVVLYRARKDQLDHVWVAEDPHNLAGDASREAITNSSVWEQALEIIRESISAEPTFHFNDYGASVDTLGLGLGSTSLSEAFTL
jgi:hypothetical protein